MKTAFYLFFLWVPFILRAQAKDGLVAKYTFNDGETSGDIRPVPVKEVGVSLVDDRFDNPKSACFLYGYEGSYLNLGTSPVLKPVEGSISLWFKIDNPIEAGVGYPLNPIILTKCADSDDFFEAYSVYYNFKTQKVGIGATQSSENQISFYSNQRVPVRQWHHLVMIYDKHFLSFYLNGKLQNKLSKNFDIHFLEGDSVMLGNSANTKNRRYFNGSIDDIFIFNRPISPWEVQQLYHAANPVRVREILKWTGIAIGFVIFLGLVFFFFNRRYKRALQKEIEKNELKSMVYETEIKVLKANMNPHFVFNVLNSIQKYVLSNDRDTAYRYLAKFSKLLRKLLESNIAEYISLEEEIDILNYYLEMESLRFEKAFNYRITIDPVLTPSRLFIPHMLVQPFIENAIWHGLLHKSGEKDLDIEFMHLDAKRIACRVEDNGVGRRNAGTRPSGEGKKSLALSFNKQRLELIKKTRDIDCGFEITDKTGPDGKGTGTIINIIIPLVN